MSQKRKEELILLQKNVLENSPDKLICSEKQLKALAYQKAENSLRIVQDCNKILQSTISPDVFFSRLQLLIQHSSELAVLEKYISFSGASPTTAFNVLMKEKQECINQFIVRYFYKVDVKASGMKTPKGKISQYQKFYDSLTPYFSEMDKNNITYIETKYNAKVKTLSRQIESKSKL